MPEWLTVRRGEAPLVLSIPHAGTQLREVREQVCSPWLATLDADWWVDQLYDFAVDLDATLIKTALSRTVIDVNRDPQARELYPGMASTELVPTTTFDGVPLYSPGSEPSEYDRARRRELYYRPYHEALQAELQRLRERHVSVVLYDAHSIRSRVPRLFDGELPVFNIGTFNARSCAPQLTAVVAQACRGLPAESIRGSHVIDGRFKGGYITRHYGDPHTGVHAIQMELACRAYLSEPQAPLDESNWPPAFSPAQAAPVQRVLRAALIGCIDFAGATS
jgi:N-formylglutamate deformylase